MRFEAFSVSNAATDFRPFVLSNRKAEMHMSEGDLQAEKGRARLWIRRRLADGAFDPHAGSTRGEHSPDMSAEMASEGWVGMSIPTEYGGPGHSAVARILVTEELLAAGAPLAAHWMAERQVAPAIMRYGSEVLKRRLLSPIAAGKCFFSVGFSEPESGSDLASVKTQARRVDGGWILNGRKIWTSDAHLNHFVEVLCRTEEDVADRHDGLSCLIVPLNADGVVVEPISYLNGASLYCEISFTGVFVQDDLLLGEPGSGWQQVTSELAHERAGPERYLAPFPFFERFLYAYFGSEADPSTDASIGLILGNYIGLREITLDIARTIDQGRAPALAAALLKDCGTRFEQDVVEYLRSAIGRSPSLRDNPEIMAILAQHKSRSPLYTIGGGTTEILRIVAGKRIVESHGTEGSSLEDLLSNAPSTGEHGVLKSAVRDLLEPLDTQERDNGGQSGKIKWDAAAWNALSNQGYPLMSVPLEEGGGGATLGESAAVLHQVGRRALRVPMETATMVLPWISSVIELPTGAVASVYAPLTGDNTFKVTPNSKGFRIQGSASFVPWARVSDFVVGTIPYENGRWVFVLPSEKYRVSPSSRGRDHPHGRVTFDSVDLTQDSLIRYIEGEELPDLQLASALGLAAMAVGAMEQAAELTIAYASDRHQFGRPIAEFQLVRSGLALMVQRYLVARAVVRRAFAESEPSVKRAIACSAVAATRSAGTEVSRISHQLHGAIGTAQEYPLSRVTKAIFDWQLDIDALGDWERQSAQILREQGPEFAWAAITGLLDGFPDRDDLQFDSEAVLHRPAV